MYEAQITTNYLSKQFDVNYNSGLNIRPFTVSFNIQLSNCGEQFETLSHSDWMSVTRVGSSCQRPWEVGKRRALNLQKHGMEPRKIVHTTEHFVATKLKWRPSYCDIYRTGNLLLKAIFLYALLLTQNQNGRNMSNMKNIKGKSYDNDVVVWWIVSRQIFNMFCMASSLLSR